MSGIPLNKQSVSSYKPSQQTIVKLLQTSQKTIVKSLHTLSKNNSYVTTNLLKKQ